jgi:Rad3-related DNA helicase
VGIEGRFAYDSFRPGRRELAQRVYEACVNGKTLIAEAMSGFAKTAAVLTGALSAAEEGGFKVVYACRTKRQINRVVEEIARPQGRHVRSPGKRGFVFFFDERFGSTVARELMPSWLKRDLIVGDLSPSSIAAFSHEFWSTHG